MQQQLKHFLEVPNFLTKLQNLPYLQLTSPCGYFQNKNICMQIKQGVSLITTKKSKLIFHINL